MHPPYHGHAGPCAPTTCQLAPNWQAKQLIQTKHSTRSKWVRQRGAVGPLSPGAPAAAVGWVETRSALEELLEREAVAGGGVWLGQLVNGQWEIRGRSVLSALTQVLTDLSGAGLVRTLSAAVAGKSSHQFAVANRYVKGTPFPRKRGEKPEVEAVEEEERMRWPTHGHTPAK